MPSPRTLPPIPEPSTAARPLRVLKFGGTSVGSAEPLRRVVSITAQACSDGYRPVLVVSALSGVTDALVAGWPEAALEPGARPPLFRDLLHRHLTLAGDVLPEAARAPYAHRAQAILAALDRFLDEHACRLPPAALRDAWLATGERLAAPLVAALLEAHGFPARAEDAAGLLVTNDAFGEATVLEAETTTRVRAWYRTLPAGTVPVVTGFIGATREGLVTTLGRGGSDYAAACLAAALRATALERWTDIDGLYTDDPRRHPGARHLARLDMSTAEALHRTRGLGMHPRVFAPLRAAGIPLLVRCTTRPDRHTRVVPDRAETGATEPRWTDEPLTPAERL
ncbi:aspartate kinase [Rhodocaloribacter litoris]|uniref:amino acid kinase family protein n=1 Tax=Rhodocaloribacter litoris TaxID=2558931 RepID=UPI001424536B|nr:aspartate kinase [Rhodocaloribacter litoris]QXD15335.1 aspartate kinase [Rhodocaloribacter litoris]